MISQPNEADPKRDTFIQDCMSELTDQTASRATDQQKDLVDDQDFESPTTPSLQAIVGVAQEMETPAHGLSPSRSLTHLVQPVIEVGSPMPRDAAEIDAVAIDSAAMEPEVADHVRSRMNVNRRAKNTDVHPVHLATSTFVSLVMVLALLLLARLIVPSLVENIRYGWYRGQLRAEYEMSGEQLKSISLDSLADVSQLVSRRTGPSVVHINLLSDQKTLDRIESLLGTTPDAKSIYRYQGQGSGFVIDSGGYILTNNHVVDNVVAIEVTLSDGRKLAAEVVGSDPLTDLAVLKVKADNLMAVDWGDSDNVDVGTPVWAVGSPFGLRQTVTFGIISGKHRIDFSGTRETPHGGTPYGDLMQSDVALNPGNSGGPLVNSLGQVVGVNAAILGDSFRGVSFSIPSRVAQRVAEHLIAEGEVPRGWLGVKLEDPDDEERFAVDGTPRAGVHVVGFPVGLTSPARVAGLRVGDKILAFEGIEVASSADLIRMIGESSVGKTVTLDVERKARKLVIEVILDRRAVEANRL